MISNFKQFLDKLSKVKVLVFGDVMLDRFWYGSVNRISPEAPVPVVNLEKVSSIPGGAANVAANIRGLGATPYLFGAVGDDAEGKDLVEILETKDINSEFLFVFENYPTTVKTRIIAYQQQIVRVDNELKRNPSLNQERLFMARLESALEKVDVVLISDYNKGLLTDNLLSFLIQKSRDLKKIVLVDPKGKDFNKYKEASVLTPNKKESLEATGLDEVFGAGDKLLKELGLDSLLITLGEEGMVIFEKDTEPVQLSSLARHVYDVTGAGDTVIATLAVCLGAGANLITAAEFANAAAGFVVEEVGTTAITVEKLKELEGRL